MSVKKQSKKKIILLHFLAVLIDSFNLSTPLWPSTQSTSRLSHFFSNGCRLINRKQNNSYIATNLLAHEYKKPIYSHRRARERGHLLYQQSRLIMHWLEASWWHSGSKTQEHFYLLINNIRLYFMCAFRWHGFVSLIKSAINTIERRWK